MCWPNSWKRSCCPCHKEGLPAKDDTEVLLIDASNAFNSLNGTVALHNIQYLCLQFVPILISTYRDPAAYLLMEIFYIQRRGPLAMPPCALATV